MYSKFNWSREPCRASIHCRWLLSPGSFTKWAGKRNQSRDWRGVARRGAADATCSRRTAEKLKNSGDSMTPRSSRGGMRAFRGRPMQPPFLWDPAEHRKRGPPPRQRDVIGCGRGRGRSVTGVSPREWLLSQNQSIHGAKLRSAMEKEEGEERRGGEGGSSGFRECYGTA